MASHTDAAGSSRHSTRPISTAYRPFFLDANVPYTLRFQWTGEREPVERDDDENDEGAIAIGAAGIASTAGGEGDVYWKVVASGQIAKSDGAGEGAGGDVTLRIPSRPSATGGMAPFGEKVFKRSEVVLSTREAWASQLEAWAE